MGEKEKREERKKVRVTWKKRRHGWPCVRCVRGAYKHVSRRDFSGGGGGGR